jgi:diketogulonate reductase-like aldo/keto reductase
LALARTGCLVATKGGFGGAGHGTPAVLHREIEQSFARALAWLLRRSPAMLPIPGSLSSAHVEENLAAMAIDLSAQEFDALTAVGAPRH